MEALHLICLVKRYLINNFKKTMNIFEDDKGYAAPIAGIAGFGAPAVVLHQLNKAFDDAGLKRNLQVSNKALKAVGNFTKLRSDSMTDPALFFPEYVSRARAATTAKLFGANNPTSVAEAMNDSVLVDSIKKLPASLQRRLGPIGSALGSIAHRFQSSPAQYESAKESLEKAIASGATKDALTARMNAGLASHMLGTSGRYEDAYLRLLDEVSGASVDRVNHPVFFAARRKGTRIAEDIYEAVKNHTAPTREGFSGIKSFGSASDYLDELWKNTTQEGALHGVPGAYRNTANIAERIINNSSSREAAIEELERALGGKKSLYSTLRERLGTSAKYELTTNELGKKVLRKVPGTAVTKGLITNKKKAIEAGLNDLATSIFHGDATRMFAGAAAGHSGDYSKLKMFSILQKIRNPYIRAALGLGSLGSAGLLINNIRENNTTKSKAKRWFRELVR